MYNRYVENCDVSCIAFSLNKFSGNYINFPHTSLLEVRFSVTIAACKQSPWLKLSRFKHHGGWCHGLFQSFAHKIQLHVESIHPPLSFTFNSQDATLMEFYNFSVQVANGILKDLFSYILTLCLGKYIMRSLFYETFFKSISSKNAFRMHQSPC